MSVLRQLTFGLLVIGLMVTAGYSHADDDEDRRKPPTKQTEKLSPAVYEKISAAQEALEQKDLATAESIMNELKARADEGELNDYETAQTYNFLAAIHYEQGDTAATIQDYLKILSLEQAPEQLQNNSLFRLAQLYFVEEDYPKAIRVLDEWMRRVESVRPEAHILKAQAYYQLGDYARARDPIIAAMREAKRREAPLRESWLALLRAVYYELEEYQSAVRVLAELIERWPKASYYKQLAGMLGLMGSQEGQLYAMHAAKVSGMLTNESELLNTARLYMAEDAPFAAVELLQAGLEDGRIEETADTLQLLAQAMSLAKDAEGQIPVLERAAKLSNSAKQYVYLGQAQVALYRWSDAAESLERALQIGGVERPGSLYMQIGTAHYNLKRYSRALQAFREARAHEDYAQQAAQWIRFVGQEIERQKALRDL